MIWALISALGLISFGCLVGSFIHAGHPIKERPLQDRTKPNTPIIIEFRRSRGNIYSGDA